jgi:tRNA G18 (ribose-2'-O)-methylase SpoU
MADASVYIPLHGDINSLIVSVAFGVLGYELVRQRSVTVRSQAQ